MIVGVAGGVHAAPSAAESALDDEDVHADRARIETTTAVGIEPTNEPREAYAYSFLSGWTHVAPASGLGVGLRWSGQPKRYVPTSARGTEPSIAHDDIRCRQLRPYGYRATG